MKQGVLICGHTGDIAALNLKGDMRIYVGDADGKSVYPIPHFYPAPKPSPIWFLCASGICLAAFALGRRFAR